MLLPLILTLSADVTKLGFMTGCHVMTAGPVTIEEHWSRPAAGTMIGYSRTMKGGKTVFHEFMRIDVQGDTVVYNAREGAKNATPFRATTLTEDEVIFENPQHDFPQRILYRRTADGLTARIDGVEKGKPKSEDFPMKTVPCR